MRALTPKEQDLYDGLILIINHTVKHKEDIEIIIKGLDDLIDLLTNPYLTEEEAIEFFGGGK